MLKKNTADKPLTKGLLQPNNSDEDPFFSRGITFTRAFTIDTTSLKRTVTQTLGFDDDTEEQWTQRLLETYNKAAEAGVEGDIPLPAEFARNYDFWKTMFVTGAIGTVLGLAGLGFLNFADYVSRAALS